MLKPSVVRVIEDPGVKGPGLQALLEAAISDFLAGRVQAVLIAAPWGEKSLLHGYYQAYREPPKGYAARRRISGGPDILVEPRDYYIGLFYASESLDEVVDLARRIEQANRDAIKGWGATRLGPRPLAAGVVEAVLTVRPSIDSIIELLNPEGPRIVRDYLPLEAARKLEDFYENPRWPRYYGAMGLPYVCEMKRDGFLLRTGASLTEDKYFAVVRVDGTFHAAPPSGPFSMASFLEGMPFNELTLDALEIRAATQIEWYPFDPLDVRRCFERLTRQGEGS